MAKDWTRWVFASVSKFFDDNRQGLTFTIEGEEQKTQSLQEYFELRMNGPHVRTYSGFTKLCVVLNVLVVTKNDSTDLYKIYKNVGVVVEAMAASIPVYKYGDGDTFLGCLVRTEHESEEIKVSHLGQVNPDVKEMQSVVQAYYEMLLEA